ncbi:transglycosylase domain-containing protein [Streptomyces sp. URMC 125]|uniref:transglycosylase domain-containing protein n=1 Tax=Streptomyces sp. URMC 125 TaxID=3423419 RepID=UPI003F1BE772
MSEHRRKPPQSRGRRAAQPPSGGRRAAPSHGAAPGHGTPADRPHGGRAEARRAAQRSAAGGGRRRAVSGSTAASGRGRTAPSGGRRLVDYPRSDRYGWRRWLPSWKLVAGLCAAGFALLVGMVGLALAWVDVPDENITATQQNNVYYWSDKTVMARVGATNRQNVDIKDIPKSMQDAVIAAENETFWKDKGVDPMGIGRAVFNMATGGDTQGGSTITQQFVKNNYLTQDQTITRKVRELFISIKVNQVMTKEKILQGYLNTSYYGRNAHGIQAAAQAYFEKDASKLNPSESAFLAAVLKGADLYDPAGGVGPNSKPKQNRERAEKRWKWILDRQVEVGLMPKSERDKYTEFPEVAPRKAQAGTGGQNGYLVSVAEEEVKKKLGIDKKQFDRGGYQIYTTFDKEKVAAMAKAVEKVHSQYIKPDKRPDKDRFVQFGAASVEPGTGKIVAIYGGPGFDKNHFINNADTQGVPVGSTWKPFVLGAAMEYGTYRSGGEGVSPESKYNGDNKLKVKRQDGTDYLDKEGNPFYQVNDADKDHGYITLRRAMEVSANTPFVQLGMDVGMDKVKRVASSAGIEDNSFDPNLNPSFALGTSTPGAIEMANSYATFAASGTHVDTYSVVEVRKNGEKKPGFDRPQKETAMDSNIAANITDVLRGVIEKPHGTGYARARALGRPAAGKTGTTDENKSAWWVGYTPQLSTAVTMFRTDPDEGRLLSMNKTGGFDSIHGGALPTQVWVDYMTAALKGQPVKDFPKARPIGKKADQIGAPSPTPSPSEEVEPSPSQEETTEPSQEPTTSAPTSPSPSGSESCEPWDWLCRENGGQENGGTDQGSTSTGSQDNGGSTTGSTTGTDTGGTDTGATTEGTEGNSGRPGGEEDGGSTIWGNGGT